MLTDDTSIYPDCASGLVNKPKGEVTIDPRGGNWTVPRVRILVTSPFLSPLAQ